MELLLSYVISCSDGKWILDGIYRSSTSNLVKTELVIEVIGSMPDNCKDSDYRGGPSKVHDESTR